jgi:hypothetical protein
MASFIQTAETLALRQAGVVSRHGARLTTRALNQAAGSAEGLLLAPSGTTGLECIAPTTAALVNKSIGFSLFRPLSEDFDSTHHYADNEAVALMEEGHMYVLCEGTCVADQPVYARITSDGASNTVLGKVLAGSDVVAGGVVITPDASFAAVASGFTIVLDDGAGPESFTFVSDATPTTAEVAAGLVALIDASSRFAATGTVTISVTSTTGVVEIVSIDERLVVTTPARAVRIPGCFFDESRTGAGLVEIRLNKIN